MLLLQLRLVLLWLAPIALVSQAIAVAQPLIVTLQLNPRPSPFLSDWEQRAETQMVISIANTSTQVQNVYFTGRVEGDNGVSGETKSGFKPPRPLQIVPNSNMSYTGMQLKGMFQIEKISTQGYNQTDIERSGMLPEGYYTFCVEVRDFQTDQLLTSLQPSACSPSFNIVLTQPPIITQPYCGETLTTAPGQPILFSWMPAMPKPLSVVEYRLRIVEIIPQGRNPGDALQSATTPPAFSIVVPSTTYLLNPLLLTPPHQKGKVSYAFDVTALDRTNRISFANNGVSEACYYYYEPGVLFAPEPPKPKEVDSPQTGKAPEPGKPGLNTTTEAAKYCNCQDISFTKTDPGSNELKADIKAEKQDFFNAGDRKSHVKVTFTVTALIECEKQGNKTCSGHVSMIARVGDFSNTMVFPLVAPCLSYNYYTLKISRETESVAPDAIADLSRDISLTLITQCHGKMKKITYKGKLNGVRIKPGKGGGWDAAEDVPDEEQKNQIKEIGEVKPTKVEPDKK